MILVFVLRQIGNMPSRTLVMREGPRSLLDITEGSGAILRTAGSTSAVDEEATLLFRSPDAEYHLTNYLMYVSRCESGSATFLRRGYPNSDDVVQSSSPKRSLGLS